MPPQVSIDPTRTTPMKKAAPQRDTAFFMSIM